MLVLSMYSSTVTLLITGVCGLWSPLKIGEGADGASMLGAGHRLIETRQRDFREMQACH